MYLNIGRGTIIKKSEIIGIFDLDITSQSHLTRSFLSVSDKAGRVVNASEDIPKTFIICASECGKTVYLSQMSSATLLKRSENNGL